MHLDKIQLVGWISVWVRFSVDDFLATSYVFNNVEFSVMVHPVPAGALSCVHAVRRVTHIRNSKFRVFAGPR